MCCLFGGLEWTKTAFNCYCKGHRQYIDNNLCVFSQVIAGKAFQGGQLAPHMLTTAQGNKVLQATQPGKFNLLFPYLLLALPLVFATTYT